MLPVYKLFLAVGFGLLLTGCLADGEAVPEAGGSASTAVDTEPVGAEAEGPAQEVGDTGTDAADVADAGDPARPTDPLPDAPSDAMTVAGGETEPRAARPEPDRARRLILPPELLDEPENAPLRRLPPDVGIERAAIDGRLAIPDRLRVGPEAQAAEDAAPDDTAIAANPDPEAEAETDGPDAPRSGLAEAIDDRAAAPAAEPPSVDGPGVEGPSVDGDDGTADSPPLLEPAAAAGVQAWAPSQRVRQGPWHVVCYQDNQVVFEHDAIYRVWRADHNPPQWAYETIDGVRFRGRIGTDVNCTWQRL